MEDECECTAHESISREGRDTLLDDLSWSSIKATISRYSHSSSLPSSLKGLVAVTYFSTFASTHRSSTHPHGLPGLRGKDKEQTRVDTALANRLLWMIWFVLTQALPILLVVPASDDVDLFELPEYAEARKRFHKREGKAANHHYKLCSTTPINMQHHFL